MNPSLIEMRGVIKQFGSKLVLDGLDWRVGAGQVIGLLGRNGAGKSSLLEERAVVVQVYSDRRLFQDFQMRNVANFNTAYRMYGKPVQAHDW